MMRCDLRALTLCLSNGSTSACLEEIEAPVPDSNSVLVAVKAVSLNFHDLAVIRGHLPASDGRILMSDGAGEVVEVGANVQRFKRGDRIISRFFPHWRDGDATPEQLRSVPGDHIDGFGAEFVSVQASSITRAPAGM